MASGSPRVSVTSRFRSVASIVAGLCSTSTAASARTARAARGCPVLLRRSVRGRAAVTAARLCCQKPTPDEQQRLLRGIKPVRVINYSQDRGLAAAGPGKQAVESGLLGFSADQHGLTSNSCGRTRILRLGGQT
jgi:hypothetical protein